MSLLIVGSMAFDSIRTPFGTAERVLGGSATYAGLAASYFTDVSLVAVVGEDFRDEHFRPFQEKGIDVTDVQRVTGKSFFWAGEYSHNLNERKTLVTELNVFAAFRPQVGSDQRNLPYVFLGNIDPELQNHVLDQMTGPRLVALDTMNFWIESRPQELAQVLQRVDVLLVNEEEARMLADEYNIIRAARRIATLGPQTVIVKRGEYGALVYMGEDFFITPAFPLQELADPTGAGDCFAGGFMGYLAGSGRFSQAEIRRAALYGTIMASFSVERFSVERIRELTFPEIRERYERFRSMIHVADS